jgi:hypothetical protein
VNSPDYPLVLVLLEGQPAPSLAFLRQLHWIVTPDPAGEQVIAQLLDATGGDNSKPGELWRYTKGQKKRLWDRWTIRKSYKQIERPPA